MPCLTTYLRYSILFCKAKPEECQELKQILQKYENTSGQKINTDKSSIFFSPNIDPNTKEAIFPFWGRRMTQNTPSIWGFHPSLGDQKSRSSLLLKRGWVKNLRVGRASFYLWGARKFLLRRLPKQFPPTPWAVFSSHKAYVKILRVWWEAFGGAKSIKKQRWLGLDGNKCATRSQGGAWASGTCRPLTLLCWRSKHGE